MTPVWNELQGHQRKDHHSKWFWQIGKWHEKAGCTADRTRATISASVGIVNCVKCSIHSQGMAKKDVDQLEDENNETKCKKHDLEGTRRAV